MKFHKGPGRQGPPALGSLWKQYPGATSGPALGAAGWTLYNTLPLVGATQRPPGPAHLWWPPLQQDIERILFSEEKIAAGIDRVARELTCTYSGTDFTVVAVLKGSCIFVADLIRRIPISLQLAFVAASSYGQGTQPGQLDLSFFPTGPEIRGRELLLVDDILDSGRTLSAIVAELQQRGAARVRTCVFLDKPTRRRVPFQADFSVFEVEDTFVVGYGLDFGGRYRNLPYVGALHASLYGTPSEKAPS